MADSQTIRIGLSEVRSDTVQWSGSQYILGSGGGAKSLVFSNSVGAQTVLANPTTTRTLSIPDADGTIGLVTGIAVAGSTFTNGSLLFSNSNGISFGMNGSTITAQMKAVSYYDNGRTQQNNSVNINSNSNNASSLQRMFIPRFSATRMDVLGSLTVGGSTAGTFGIFCALYTFAASTASSVSSGSIGVTFNSGTSNAASLYGGQSGLRWRSVPLGTWNITPGEYMLALAITQGGVAGTTGSWSLYGAGGGITANMPLPGGLALSAYFGDGVAQFTGGTAPVASIHLSNIDQTVSNAQFQPGIRFIGTGP